MQLTHAYVEFRVYCDHHQLSHSHPAFSPKSLSLKNQHRRPYRKGKAANMLHIGSWLAAVIMEYANLGDDWADVRANCIYGFDNTIQILKGAPFILNDGHAEQSESSRQAALIPHGYLSQAAAQRRLGRWLTKPKHHLFDHCVRNMILDRVNVTFLLSFEEASFVGLIKRTAHSCHGGDAIEVSVVKRWHLLHACSECADS